ncbi:hypothetical protein F5Y08DRAFT_28868 [Xylaria arbuscula]|nr:hypothetical protein F5Y08DRAFT_28868 [Xylaria arbuscula]
MLQHRRLALVVLAALLVVYVYNFCAIAPGYGVLDWIHWEGNHGNSDVMNATLGFERIFVINLPSRRDRRDAMTLAGAVSNLNLTFIKGLTGDKVTLPVHTNSVEDDPSGMRSFHSMGARGSWGSHLSALQAIVELGLGSALVLEDDVDWDVRLKAQMQTFATASQMWLDAQQQRGSMNGFLAASTSTEADFERNIIPLLPHSPSFDRYSRTTHGMSPYGEEWDILWLGHCGADLPNTHRDAGSGVHPSPSSTSAKSWASSSLEITIADDETVPAPKHLQPHPFALHDALADAYPAHTRVVHAVRGNVCSLGYAVSQDGARKLLRRFSKDGFVTQWDLMLRDYCMGEKQIGESEKFGRGKKKGKGKGDHESLICLTVQPPLISHRYVQEGGASVSDISGQGGGFTRTKTGTPYVRLSVQDNLDRLLAGYPEERLVDQLPDDGNLLW